VSADAEQNTPEEEKPRGEAGRWDFRASPPQLPTAPDFADDWDARHDEKGTTNSRRSKVRIEFFPR
jgi:hypothetical protein